MSQGIGTIELAASGAHLATAGADDRAQIHDVLALYGRLYDDHRIDDFMTLIAADATFYPNWPGVAPEQVSGHAALKEFFAGARAFATSSHVQPRHFATNVLITRADATSAEATVSMLYAESSPGGVVALKMLGQYDYGLVKRDGRWLLHRWSMRYDQ
jgi:hypothetical protein